MTGDARMMRCYGRDHKHRRRRFNERATGRERIGGGARRRGHDQAVGAIVIEQFAVDAGPHRHQATGLAAGEGHFIERDE